MWCGVGVWCDVEWLFNLGWFDLGWCFPPLTSSFGWRLPSLLWVVVLSSSLLWSGAGPPTEGKTPFLHRNKKFQLGDIIQLCSTYCATSKGAGKKAPPLKRRKTDNTTTHKEGSGEPPTSGVVLHFSSLLCLVGGVFPFFPPWVMTWFNLCDLIRFSDAETTRRWREESSID